MLKTALSGLLKDYALYNQAALKEEILLTPPYFSPLVWGQEEVSMANRKPQPYCTTRGRRLELRPGALPRSRDYKKLHLMVPEPELVLDMGKTWTALEGNRAHFAFCLHVLFNKRPTYGPGPCLLRDLFTPLITTPLNIPPFPFLPQVSRPPVTYPHISPNHSAQKRM